MNIRKFMILEHISFSHVAEDHPDTSEHAPHVRSYLQIYYLICGKIKYQIENTIYDMQPGDLLLINAGEEHVVRVLSSSEPYARMMINFSPELLQNDSCRHFLEPFQNRRPGTQNHYSRNRLQDNLVHSCMKRLFLFPTCSESRAISYLIPILQDIYDAFTNRSHSVDPVPSQSQLAHEILNYVNLFAPSFSGLHELERRFGMSKNKLNRLFRTVSDQSIWQYILDKKLELAQQILKQGGRPTKVATTCGFNDYSSFYYAYKRKYGHRPQLDCANASTSEKPVTGNNPSDTKGTPYRKED